MSAGAPGKSRENGRSFYRFVRFSKRQAGPHLLYYHCGRPRSVSTSATIIDLEVKMKTLTTRKHRLLTLVALSVILALAIPLTK